MNLNEELSLLLREEEDDVRFAMAEWQTPRRSTTNQREKTTSCSCYANNNNDNEVCICLYCVENFTVTNLHTNQDLLVKMS